MVDRQKCRTTLLWENGSSWICSPACSRPWRSRHVVSFEMNGFLWPAAHRAEQCIGISSSFGPCEWEQSDWRSKQTSKQNLKKRVSDGLNSLKSLMFSRLSLEARFNHSNLFFKSCRSIQLRSRSFFLFSFNLPFITGFLSLLLDSWQHLLQWLLRVLKRVLPFKASFPRVLFSQHNQRKKKMDSRVLEVGSVWTVPVPTDTASPNKSPRSGVCQREEENKE